MSIRRKSNLARLGEANTRHQVAEFFHHVAAQLVLGQITTNGEQKYGDVVNFDAGIGIEVKSSDNRHPWRISIKQLQNHVELKEDFTSPLVDFLYFLPDYKNNEWVGKSGKRPRGLKSITYSPMGRLKTKVERQMFLKEHVHSAWLLDIAIVEAMARRDGTRMAEFPDKADHPFLRLRRRDLRIFLKNASRELRSLRLDPRRFELRRRQVRVTVRIDNHAYVTKFTLFSLLRPRSHKRLEDLISHTKASSVA